MRRRRPNRKGAAVMEMAIILFAFLVVTMGMLDLGVGVFRYHILANAARHAARRAIVHGDQADVLGPWGPATIDNPATAIGIPVIDDDEYGIQPLLVGCDLDKTRVVVEWLDGSNGFEKRVRATVRSPYQPLLLFIFSGAKITLSASSTMQIAH